MNWEQFKEEEKNRANGRHYMVLTCDRDACQKALLEIGYDSRVNRISRAKVGQHRVTFGKFLAALKEFFTIGADGEIFKWVPIEKSLFISGQYVDDCEVVINAEELNGPGIYDVTVITATSIKETPSRKSTAPRKRNDRV